MLKLRTLLLSNYLYLTVLFIVIIISVIKITLPKESMYTGKEKSIEGIITKINIDGNKLNLLIKDQEIVDSYYYFETKKEKDLITNKLLLGQRVLLKGSLEKIKSKDNTLFNYQDYQNRHNIYYKMNIEEITIINKNMNVFYKLKNYCISWINNNPYLLTFILGDTSKLKDNITSSFRNIGISHLFAISGMHISLISLLLLKFLNKIKVKEEKRYLITSIILILYFLLVNTSSILRATLFFILFSINKVYYFYIKPVNIFILTLSLSLLINPYYVFDVGFQYSFSISFTLILMGSYINQKKHYISKLLLTSLISFIISIPITINNFYSVNLLSIIYNLFFVPLISIVIFPLALISFFIPFLRPILNFLTRVLEVITLFLSKIDVLTFSFIKPNPLVLIIYYIFIIIFFYGLLKSKKKYLYPLIIIFFIHLIYPIFNKEDYLYMIDVGQGDSILLYSNNKTMLIDTGGIMSYIQSKWQEPLNKYSIVKSTTIPTLKSLGINKLDYLVLTHGDFDHLGEASILLDNFKVEKIYLNNGYYNYLEKALIKKYNNISSMKENTIIKLGDLNIEQVNKDLKDENDSSNVLLVNGNNKNILLTGDATIKSEDYILENYSLPHLDILKLGHHGSKTSMGDKLLNETTPDLCLISVGLNNKFNHPSKEVIERLNKKKIKYLKTSTKGFIKIKI